MVFLQDSFILSNGNWIKVSCLSCILAFSLITTPIFSKEQALFLKTKENELIVIVGCSHPGLEKFILKAQELSSIKAIIGGFHGFRIGADFTTTQCNKKDIIVKW